MKGWRDIGEVEQVFVYQDEEGWWWEDLGESFVPLSHGPYDTYEEARQARLDYVESIREEPLL